MTFIDRLRAIPHIPWNPEIPLQKFNSALLFQNGDALIRCTEADLDTDGEADADINHWDGDHQGQTSLDPNADWVDANTIPYVVLPPWVMSQLGFPLGTLVTVFLGGQADSHAHAILADEGPRRKIGEGSIQIWRLLGQERVRNGRIINAGVDGPVRFLFYKNSVQPAPTTCDAIQHQGEAALTALLAGG